MGLGLLRIAFATPEYVTEKYFDGGLANHTHRVAKALAGMGHDIHVLTLSEIDETQFEHEGVTVHRISSGKAWSLTPHRLPSTVRLLDFSIRVYSKLKELNAQQPLDLVQFPNYSCCGLASIFFLKLPQVLRASSYQPAWNAALGIKQTLDSRIVNGLEALQFRYSRNTFAPSITLQRMLRKEAGLLDVKVIPSPFYIETSNWDASVYDRFFKGKKYLLFFGRFQLHKGFHTLAQALPRVLEQCPDAFAALVGRDMESTLGPSMAAYARSQSGSFSTRLIMLDKLPHAQLYPVIAGAHLVVLPSLIENFPNVCLEAMGLGKAVIGTVGTSFDELISDETTGFLVTPNDPAALAEKIISAWTDPRLEEIGTSARQAMSKYAPETTIEMLLNYYREVLNA